MCGIVGAVAQRDTVAILMEGLRRLEYRGYDSAGMVVLGADNALQRIRAKGKIKALEAAYEQSPLAGSVGIAHTRWATHGKPSLKNAHPHVSREMVAVVHNGIIENHDQLRDELQLAGYEFTSDTDTEVIVHRVHHFMSDGADLLAAVTETIKGLDGAFALGVVGVTDPGRLIAARRGSPLVIGIGIGEYFIASDVAALLPVTQRFIFLEEGDIADIRKDKLVIYDEQSEVVERAEHVSELNSSAIDRGEYRHHMLKEIFEQPKALSETLEGRIRDHRIAEDAFGVDASLIFDDIDHIQIIACGTSFHAGMVARYWFEAIAGIPCNVEVASEFRYRKVVKRKRSLIVTISQSGETADTLAALREAKKRGWRHSLSICNVAESTLVRESDLCLLTRAGLEIGVASTKAFTTQLAALMMLVIVIGRRYDVTEEKEKYLVEQLLTLPGKVEKTLGLSEEIKLISEQFSDKQHALFLGRGTQYPVAMEGALKLKEISYIHAEAYPAGELKHGPLALVDNNMPVVAVAPNNELLEKLKSNLHEVRARGGELIVFADATVAISPEEGMQVIEVLPVDDVIAPIVYTIPLQLLSYHVAVIKGTDIDQPRNLAKSVTVE